MPRNSRTKTALRGNKYGGSLHGGPSQAVSYSHIDPQLLHAAITQVTDNGDAITLGRTAEGGAYYLGILCEGTLEKFYLDCGEDVEDCLRRVASVTNAVVP